MNNLNDDCLLYIFQYFSPKDRLSIGKVCRRWQELMKSLWQHESKLEFESGRNLYKKRTVDYVGFETIREIIHQCGAFVRHIDLENVVVVNKFVTVRLGVYTYRTLISNFTVGDLLATLMKYCHNLVTLSLNTKQITAEQVKDVLLRSSKTLLKVKICGIDTGTCIDDYLELLPNRLEKLDLFFIDCQLNNGLHNFVKRSSNLRDLRCVCYKVMRVNGLIDGILRTIGSYAVQLNRLCLRQLDNRVSDSAFKSIANLVNLEYLKLEQFDNTITDDFISEITCNCKKLQFISLCGCPVITNSGMNSILTLLPKLEDLEIYHGNMSTFICEKFLDTIPNLKRFYVTNCPNLTEDSLCNVIRASPNITTLFISRCFFQQITLCFAISISFARNQNFILKKWKALNSVPLRILIKAFANQKSAKDVTFRFLIYENDSFDSPEVSSTNCASFVKTFTSINLPNCQVLQ